MTTLFPRVLSVSCGPARPILFQYLFRELSDLEILHFHQVNRPITYGYYIEVGMWRRTAFAWIMQGTRCLYARPHEIISVACVVLGLERLRAG